MKKVLLAIAAVATITSCSQNEEFENPAQNAEINFSTIVSKSTRAVIIENKDFKKLQPMGILMVKRILRELLHLL